jgi:hypothetical protein
LSLLLGGVMGLMGWFLIAEKTPLRMARAMLWMPLPFSALLPLAAWLHPHRIPGMCLMGLLAAVMFVLARLGPIWLITGAMMFAASMLGVAVTIPVALCGRILILSVCSVAAVLVAWLLLCRPMPYEELLRNQRAFLVEARRIAGAASVALSPDAKQATAIRRMRRALRRLNITTLTIDGHLTQPALAADPHTVELLHQYLFDAELALQGIGQAVQQLASRRVPAQLRETLILSLGIAQNTPLGRVAALRPAAALIRRQAAADQVGLSAEEAEVRALSHRIGDLLDALADALSCWLSLAENSPTERARAPFQGTVVLMQNRPAGAALVAERVAMPQGADGWRRLLLHLRTPLQAVVAIAIVCPIADAIDGSHFYWGVVGVLVSLFGVSTTRDRLHKLGHRMLGTAVGAALGIGALHLIGPGHTYETVAFIVVVFSLGAWGRQRRYAYFVIGLVAALSQLYGLSTPYHGMDWLLTRRLIGNGLGMVIGTACAAVVFPISTGKIVREAKRGYVSALEQLVAQVADRWRDRETPVRLRGAARGVDAALFQVQSVLQPLIRIPLGIQDRGNETFLALLGTATQHARALAATADTDVDITSLPRIRVERISEVFTDSLYALREQISTGRHGGTWIRVSPMIHEADSVLLNAPFSVGAERLRLALHELSKLDEVLAHLADNLGLSVAITPQPMSVIGTLSAAHSSTADTTPRVFRQGRGRHRARRTSSTSDPSERGSSDSPGPPSVSS